MTEAMPFLQKAILLSYDPRPLAGGRFFLYHHGLQRLHESYPIEIRSSLEP